MLFVSGGGIVLFVCVGRRRGGETGFDPFGRCFIPAFRNRAGGSSRLASTIPSRISC